MEILKLLYRGAEAVVEQHEFLLNLTLLFIFISTLYEVTANPFIYTKISIEIL